MQMNVFPGMDMLVRMFRFRSVRMMMRVGSCGKGLSQSPNGIGQAKAYQQPCRKGTPIGFRDLQRADGDSKSNTNKTQYHGTRHMSQAA